MPDYIRRPLRTLAQMIAGGALTVLVDQLVLDLDGSQRIYVTIAFGLLVSFCQNILEDTTQMPALGKSPASPGQNPAPDPGPGKQLERPAAEVDPRASWGIYRKPNQR